MSSTSPVHLYVVGLCPSPAPAWNPRVTGATRLELIAKWKERHGYVDMSRLADPSRSRARAATQTS